MPDNLPKTERVNHKPFINGPDNQTVTVGSSTVLNCEIVLSDLHPHMQWMKHYEVNGSFVDENGKPNVIIIQVGDVTFCLYVYFVH